MPIVNLRLRNGHTYNVPEEWAIVEDEPLEYKSERVKAVDKLEALAMCVDEFRDKYVRPAIRQVLNSRSPK